MEQKKSFLINGVLLFFPNSKDPLPASPAQPERIPYPEHACGPHDKIHYYLPDGE